MSKLDNVAHNILSRLPNAAAVLKISDGSYHALEYLYHVAKSNCLPEMHFELVSGKSSISLSDDVKIILSDLNDQMNKQMVKLGINEKVISCDISLKFDLDKPCPQWVNKREDSCEGLCKIKLSG